MTATTDPDAETDKIAKHPPVSFANDISPEFQQYLGNMRWRFDLTNYDQVKANAEMILKRMAEKSMPPPPFAPFSQAVIDSFRAWIYQKYPK